MSGMTDLEPGTEHRSRCRKLAPTSRSAPRKWLGAAGSGLNIAWWPARFETLQNERFPRTKVKGYALSLADHAGFDALRWHGLDVPCPSPARSQSRSRRAG